jgi:hypothetical protein
MAIDPAILQFFSISTHSDLNENGEIIHDIKYKTNSALMCYGNAAKILQWIPIISIIASVIFAWITDSQIMNEIFKTNNDTKIKIAFICRAVIVFLAPLALFVDLAGTALKSCYNQKMKIKYNLYTESNI